MIDLTHERIDRFERAMDEGRDIRKLSNTVLQLCALSREALELRQRRCVNCDYLSPDHGESVVRSCDRFYFAPDDPESHVCAAWESSPEPPASS